MHEPMQSHMKIKRSLTLLMVFFSLIACPYSRGGGSIVLSEVQPLLKQQPVLWKFFTDHFDISPNGCGLRLGQPGIPLRGSRVGPYEFPAKFKESKGDYDLKIIIKTDLYFMDKEGNNTSDEMAATEKEEVLTDVAVAPMKSPSRNGTLRHGCPE